MVNYKYTKQMKKITIPKKPKTKRDLFMYDLGAREQAEIFSDVLDNAEQVKKDIKWGSSITNVNYTYLILVALFLGVVASMILTNHNL